MSPPFAIELLGEQHERDVFACGVEPLDRYFKQHVSQDVRGRATACYALREMATDALAGYYTLAAGSVLLFGMPQNLAKKLPRYPDVPVARVGRLAADLNFRGRKLGAVLLSDRARSPDKLALTCKISLATAQARALRWSGARASDLKTPVSSPLSCEVLAQRLLQMWPA